MEVGAAETRGLAASLLLTLGASLILHTNPPLQPDQRFHQALTLLRDGDFVNAATLARGGWQGLQPSDRYWQFRLLEAEALMGTSKPNDALRLLEPGLAKPSVKLPHFWLTLSSRSTNRCSLPAGPFSISNCSESFRIDREGIASTSFLFSH